MLTTAFLMAVAGGALIVGAAMLAAKAAWRALR